MTIYHVCCIGYLSNLHHEGHAESLVFRTAVFTICSIEVLFLWHVLLFTHVAQIKINVKKDKTEVCLFCALVTLPYVVNKCKYVYGVM